jgi:hypothetical protein
MTLFIIFWDDSKNRRERNNNPLRSSASSAVNLFCHDPLNPEEIKKSHKNNRRVRRGTREWLTDYFPSAPLCVLRGDKSLDF